MSTQKKESLTPSQKMAEIKKYIDRGIISRETLSDPKLLNWDLKQLGRPELMSQDAAKKSSSGILGEAEGLGVGALQGLVDMGVGALNIGTSIPRAINVGLKETGLPFNVPNIPAITAPTIDKDIQEANPLASTIGNIAGTFVLPEGKVADVAEKGVTSLEKKLSDSELMHRLGTDSSADFMQKLMSGAKMAKYPAEGATISAIYGASDPSGNDFSKDLAFGALGGALGQGATKALNLLSDKGGVAAARLLKGVDPKNIRSEVASAIKKGFKGNQDNMKKAYKAYMDRAESEGFGNDVSAQKRTYFTQQPPGKDTPIQANLFDPENEEFIKSVGADSDLKSAIDKFSKQPSFPNAHMLQSKLEKEARSLSLSRDSADRKAAGPLSEQRRNLLSDINSSFEGAGKPDLGVTYTGLGQLYKEKMVPYFSPGIFSVVKKGKKPNPSTLFNDKVEDHMKVYDDLPENIKDLVAYDALRGNTVVDKSGPRIKDLNKATETASGKDFGHLFDHGDIRNYLDRSAKRDRMKNLLGAGGIGAYAAENPWAGALAGAAASKLALLQKGVEGASGLISGGAKIVPAPVRKGAKRGLYVLASDLANGAQDN